MIIAAVSRPPLYTYPLDVTLGKLKTLDPDAYDALKVLAEDALRQALTRREP